MTKHDMIPGGDIEFDIFFRNYCQVVAKYTAGTSPAWSHIPADRVTELNDAYAAWYTAWSKLEGAHIHADIVAKNEARNAGEHTLREFHNEFILYSRKVTDAQIDELGCERRDTTPTNIAVPTSQGMAEIRYGGINELILANIHAVGTISADPRSDYGPSVHFGVYDPNNPNGRFRIGALPVTGDDLPHAVFTRKKKLRLNLEGCSGMTAYFSIRYENEKGEPGPYGPIFSAVIP